MSNRKRRHLLSLRRSSMWSLLCDDTVWSLWSLVTEKNNCIVFVNQSLNIYPIWCMWSLGFHALQLYLQDRISIYAHVMSKNDKNLLGRCLVSINLPSLHSVLCLQNLLEELACSIFNVLGLLACNTTWVPLTGELRFLLCNSHLFFYNRCYQVHV